MKRFPVLVALALCVALLTTPLLATEPVVTRGKAIKSDTSEPIRDLLKRMPPPAASGLSMEIPVQARPGTEQRADPGVARDNSVTGPSDTLTPAVDLSFEGLSDDDNAVVIGGRIVPPDTNGDIGLDGSGGRIYVQYINLIWGIWDADDGSVIAGPMPGNTFWTGFGGPCEASNSGDPVVLYDDDAGRWVFNQFVVGSGLQCFAISTTSDPLGPYNRYAFLVASASGTPDYPKSGVWAQESVGAKPRLGVDENQSSYTLTTRNFPFSPASFSQLIALERDVMLAGGGSPGIYQVGFPCVTGDCLEGALPPHQAGTPPPFGTCPTFASIVDASYDDTPTGATDGVRLFQVCPNWDSGSGTISETFAPSSADFDRFLGNGFSDCISPVPSGGEVLDCLSLFTMFRAQYRYFDGVDDQGTHGSMVLNTTVDSDGADTAGIHWMELRSVDGDTGWSINQESTYAPDGSDRWMGSIAQNGDRDIALGFSVTNATLPPSVHYAARQCGDDSGTLGGEEICHTGTGVQQSSANRWGDYSSMSVDPTDDCTFWYTQEYYETTGSFDFTTRICSFTFPGCGDGCQKEAGVPNDLCENKITLDCDSITAGTTIGAGDEDDPDCATGSAGASVWYSIDGTGGDITASFCKAGAGADFDTVLDVYDGGCDALNCVADNDDFCSLQSEVTWASTAGERYDIRVSGFSADEGDFDLAINCAELPCDDGLTVSGPAKVTAEEKFNLDITCANADTRLLVAGGRNTNGSSRFVPGCGVVAFDIGPRPNNFGTATSDGAGNATSSQTLSARFGGRTLYYQVLDTSKCEISNVLEVEVNEATQ